MDSLKVRIMRKTFIEWAAFFGVLLFSCLCLWVLLYGENAKWAYVVAVARADIVKGDTSRCIFSAAQTDQINYDEYEGPYVAMSGHWWAGIDLETIAKDFILILLQDYSQYMEDDAELRVTICGSRNDLARVGLIKPYLLYSRKAKSLLMYVSFTTDYAKAVVRREKYGNAMLGLSTPSGGKYHAEILRRYDWIHRHSFLWAKQSWRRAVYGRPCIEAFNARISDDKFQEHVEHFKDTASELGWEHAEPPRHRIFFHKKPIWQPYRRK